MYINLGQACIDEWKGKNGLFVEFLLVNLFKMINIVFDQLMNRFFNLQKHCVFSLYVIDCRGCTKTIPS